MPLPIYQRVIDQLHALDFAGRISPYLMNESLLDKRLPDLIAYARKRCPESWIAINTNGDALSLALLQRLFEAGLNSLDVNAYDNPAQHQAHVALAQRLMATHSHITLHTSYSNPFFQGDNFPRTMQLINCRDLSYWEPQFLMKIATPHLQNRSGHVPQARRLTEPLPLSCPRPFQQMYVNYRGEAVLCCNDWRFEVIMGDTAKASLGEIWGNTRYQAYRRQLQNKSRAMPLCATCDYLADAAEWE
jgi:MoaA/NifB/PqqE/SkfB family radical SAM enzyme